MKTTKLRCVFIAMAAMLAVSGFARTVHAQAWLPPQGEGVVSFVFQDQYFKYHVLPTQRVDLGPIHSRAMLVDVTYGLTDKIAVSVGVPWIAAKYTGPNPHPLSDFSRPNPIDDGTWHGAAQDFRFDVRYNITRNLLGKGIVVTPFIGSIVPSHEYTYFAHAAVGRGVKELQAGVAAAKLFEKVPNLLVQGRYGYGLTKQIVGISFNRSLASLELGYFATPRLRFMALTTGQRTHGGIDVPQGARAILPAEQVVHHDQIHREIGLAMGTGASYSLSQSVDLYGSWTRAVTQRNGHLLDRGLTVGFSWSFSTRQGSGIVRTAQKSLIRCVCEKSGM